MIQDQIFNFPLDTGIDTKTDDKISGGNRIIINGEYNKINTVNKVAGCEEINPVSVDAGTIVDNIDPRIIASSADTLYLAGKPGQGRFFFYDEIKDQFRLVPNSDVGAVVPMQVDTRTVFYRYGGNKNASVAYNSRLDYHVVVNEIDTTLTVNPLYAVTVYDKKTDIRKSYESTDTLFSLRNPSVQILDNGTIDKIYFFGTSGNDFIIGTNNYDGTVDTFLTAFSDAGTNTYHSTCVSEDLTKVYFCYPKTTANTFRVGFIDITGAVTSQVVTVSQHAVASTQGFDIFDFGGLLHFAYVTTTSRVVNILGLNLTTLVIDKTEQTIANTLAGSYKNVTITKSLSLVSDEIVLWYDAYVTATDRRSVTSNRLTFTAAYLSVSSLTSHGVYLASKGFFVANAGFGAVVVYKKEGDLLRRALVIDEGKRVLGRFADDLYNQEDDIKVMPNVAMIDSETFSFAHQLIAKYATEITPPTANKSLTNNTTLYSVDKINMTTFDFGWDYNSGSREKLGGNIHLANGYILELGREIFEHNFHWYPHFKAVTQNATTGGLVNAGNHVYVALYEFIDEFGQIHRSTPSKAVNVNNTTSTAVNRIQVRCLTLGLKSKNWRTRIALFRTAANGTTFYRVQNSPDLDEPNAELSDWVQFDDAASDSGIIDNEILYTTGGILTSDVPKNAYLIAQGGNRLFYADSEDRNLIRYSQKAKFNEAISFSDFLQIRADSGTLHSKGDITGLGYMDGKLIIFKQSSVLAVSGDGPLDTGEQDNFSDPEIISGDTGCIESRSVINTPEGIIFRSEKGMYLLNRSLALEYIGAGIEDYVVGKITSAVLIADKNQVRFTCDEIADSYLLQFDYFTRKWSLCDYYGYDSTVYKGKMVYINQDEELMLENISSTRNNNPYNLTVITPWFKVSDIQGFSRVKRIQILGKYKSAHNLIVTAYYDYSDTASDVYTMTPSNLDAQYQQEIHLTQQKCESIRFKIEVIPLSGTFEGADLTSISLLVGVKSGLMKNKVGKKEWT